MNIFAGKVERVSRAICHAAGAGNNNLSNCLFCDVETHNCLLWKSFRNEARAAIKAMQ